MSSSKEELFTEKLALYLAAGLLGPTNVIEYLNDDEREDQQAVPLYWRSKLMIPDPSRTLYHVEETKDSTPAAFPLTKMLFFDITFSFVKNLNDGEGKHNKSHLLSTQRPTASPRVLVSFGFFLLLQKGPETTCGDQSGTELGGAHYVSTQHLDYQQILSYMNSLQLDRDSVDPAKLANSMAEEFLRQGSLSSVTASKETGSARKVDHQVHEENFALTVDYVRSKESPTDIEKEENEEGKFTTFPDQSQSLHEFSQICVNIPCKSMGDSCGKLILKHSAGGVTKFDRSALRFLSWDFSKNPNNFDNASKNGEPLLSKKDLVDEAFDRWRIQGSTNASSNDKDAKNPEEKNNGKPTVSTTNVDSNGAKRNDRPKKRRYFKGNGILPSARRKRNKGLVYDT